MNTRRQRSKPTSSLQFFFPPPLVFFFFSRSFISLFPTLPPPIWHDETSIGPTTFLPPSGLPHRASLIRTLVPLAPSALESSSVEAPLGRPMITQPAHGSRPTPRTARRAADRSAVAGLTRPRVERLGQLSGAGWASDPRGPGGRGRGGGAISGRRPWRS